MTPEQIKAALVELGWEADRFGNFKGSSGNTRVVIKDKVVRLEVKLVHKPIVFASGSTYQPPNDWIRKDSVYHKDVVRLPDGRLVIGRFTLKKPNKV